MDAIGNPTRREALNLSTLEFCSTCHFWQRATTQEINGKKAARCRRFPPVAVMVQNMAQHPLTRQPVMQQGAGTVPTVTPADDWCGEWRPHLPHTS